MSSSLEPDDSLPADSDRRSINGYYPVHRLAQSYLGPLWVARHAADDEDSERLYLLRRLDLTPEGAGPVWNQLLEAGQVARRNPHRNLLAMVGPALEGSRLSFAYEHAQAEPLRALQSWAHLRSLCFPVDVALRVVIDLLGGLEAVHSQMAPAVFAFGGVSPDSVLLCRSGRTLVVDAGISSAASQLESFGSAPQKLCYSSPEHLRTDRPLTARTDVFGCGILLWELLASRRFLGGSRPAIERRLSLHQLPRLQNFLSPQRSVPEGLIHLVNAALEKDPRNRPRSAEEFARCLQDCGHTVADESQVAQFVSSLSGQRFERRMQSIRAQSRSSYPAAALHSAPPQSEVQRSSPPDATSHSLSIARENAGRTMLGIHPSAGTGAAEAPRAQADLVAPVGAAASARRSGPPATPAKAMPGNPNAVPAVSARQPRMQSKAPQQAPSDRPYTPLPPARPSQPSNPWNVTMGQSQPRRRVLALGALAISAAGSSLFVLIPPKTPSASNVASSETSLSADMVADLEQPVANETPIVRKTSNEPATSEPPDSDSALDGKPPDSDSALDGKPPDSDSALDGEPAETNAGQPLDAPPQQDLSTDGPTLSDAVLTAFFADEPKHSLTPCSDPSTVPSGQSEERFARAQRKLSQQQLEAGHLDEAAEALCRAHHHSDPGGQAKLGLAAIALRRGDAEGAQRWAQLALDFRPDEPRALEALGDAEALQGHLEQARGLWLRTTPGPDSEPKREQLAERYMDEGFRNLNAHSHARARTLFRRAVVLTSGEYGAGVALSDALLWLDAPEAARHWTTRALEARPKDARLKMLHGDALYRTGQPGEAMQAWKDSRKLQSTSSVRRRIRLGRPPRM